MFNLRAGRSVIFAVSSRAYSPIGAPRPGKSQDWRHRIVPKGFVSKRDLNPAARDLRITWHWILQTNNRSSETWIKCPRPKAYQLGMMAGFR